MIEEIEMLTCELHGVKIKRPYRMELTKVNNREVLLAQPELYDHEEVFHTISGVPVIVERYDPRKIPR